MIDPRTFAEAVEQVSREELPALIGQLAAAEAAAWARLSTPPPETPKPRLDQSQFIHAGRAAEIAGRSRRWVYDQARGSTWARRPSRGVLLIDEKHYRAFLDSR